MKGYRQSTIVDPKSIDDISENTAKYLAVHGVSSEISLRVRLCIEEALLVLYEEYDKNTSIDVEYASRLGKPYISIKYKGRKFDPIENDRKDEVSGMILDRLGIHPVYSYRSAVNKITFSLPASGIRQEVYLVGAVILAVFMGVIGGGITQGIKNFMEGYFLSPITDTFMKLLNMVAPILIFLSVITSIIKNGSGTDFGHIGKYIIGRYFAVTAVSSVMFTALFSRFFDFCHGDASDGMSGMKELFDMFMDIIPGNIIQPFIDSNMMQIIIIALALGVIILGLDNRVEYIRGTVVDLYAVFASAMELVCKLLPLFVFTSLLLSFWENGSDTIAKLWKPVLVAVLTQMGYIFVMGGYISVKYKVKISKLFAKILPSCLIGLTTASSIAAYGKGNEINKTKLGIDGRYSDLAYPLGISLYDATYSPLFIVIPFYLAEMFGVQVSAFWFIKTCVICLIVTYAAPQVPGGALICLTVILTQLGIPIEGLSVAGVLAMVLDFFTTGSKVAGQHFEMILQADHLGMLDREVLKE